MNIKPLAFRMRPRSIDEIIGQEHLVGEGKIIARMVKAKQLSSMILYGPRELARHRSQVRLPEARSLRSVR